MAQAKQQILRPVRPNQGTRTKLSKDLKRTLDELYKSVSYWIFSEYKKQLPKLAADAAPDERKSVNQSIQQRFNAQQRRWEKIIKERANRFSTRFAEKSQKETLASMNRNLELAGLKTRAAMTRSAAALGMLQKRSSREAMYKLLNDFLTYMLSSALTGLIQGKEPKAVQKQLKDKLDKTKRQAANLSVNIATKSTQNLSQHIEQELGFTTAIWVHVPGKVASRRTHERMDGKEFELSEGMYDSDVKRKVKPGELDYCRCTYRLKVPETIK